MARVDRRRKWEVCRVSRALSGGASTPGKATQDVTHNILIEEERVVSALGEHDDVPDREPGAARRDKPIRAADD
jgi:hypothetical protein